MTSLEKDLETQIEARVGAESRLSELQDKYEAAPKQEVLDRYRQEVEKLTQEVGGAKDMLKE